MAEATYVAAVTIILDAVAAFDTIDELAYDG